MPLFHTKNTHLVPITEKKISLERDLQRLTEANLEQLFGLTFVATEFQLHGLRIDTLAYDPERSAFVIIEYKRGSSFSVVDQGYAYLALMLNNKAEFLLEYNERAKKALKREDVDWTQSRVLFLADSFSAHQRGAINFKDIPMELWEVRQYEGGIIQYGQIESSAATASINTITKSKEIQEVSKEVKKYSVEDHFPKGYEVAREVYDALMQRVNDLDESVRPVPVKHYVGLRLGTTLFALVIPRKSGKLYMKIRYVPARGLTDPKKRARYDKRSVEFYNVPEFIFEISSVSEVPYAMRLIEQAYDKVAEKGS